MNKRSLDDYFPNNVLKMVIKQPLLSTETAERFDIHVTVSGGGPSGGAIGALASAIKLARAGLRDADIEYGTNTTRAIAKMVFSGAESSSDLTLAAMNKGGTASAALTRAGRGARRVGRRRAAAQSSSLQRNSISSCHFHCAGKF